MTTFVWPAIACSLLSAVFFAVGTHRQSVAVREDLAHRGISPRSTLSLLGNWMWLSGLGLLGLGMGLNVAALAMAPIMVVQPLGCIALVLTSLINARYHGVRVNRGTWVAIAVCVVGSVSFVLLAISATHESPVEPRQRWAVITVLAVVVVVFGATAFARRRRPGGAFFYIVGAGILFGLTAVLVKTIAGVIMNWRTDVPVWGEIPWGPLVAVVVAAVLGQYFNQHAYATGSPDLVIAGLTVIDPMVGVMVGIVILGELQPGISVLHACAMVVSALLAIVGVVLLSRHHRDLEGTKNTEAAPSSPTPEQPRQQGEPNR